MDWRNWALLCIVLTCFGVGVEGQCAQLINQSNINFDYKSPRTVLAACTTDGEILDTALQHGVILTCHGNTWFPDTPSSCTQPTASSNNCNPEPPEPKLVTSQDLTPSLSSGGGISPPVRWGVYYQCNQGMEWLSGRVGRLTQCVGGKWTELLDECVQDCPVPRDCIDVARLNYSTSAIYKVIPSGKLLDPSVPVWCDFLGPEEGVWTNVIIKDNVQYSTPPQKFPGFVMESDARPNSTGRYFIGLNNLMALTWEVNGTTDRPHVFQFLMFNGDLEPSYHATYDHVIIGPANTYTLQSVGNFYGNAVDAFIKCLGQNFDSSLGGNAWWFPYFNLAPFTSKSWGSYEYERLLLRVRPKVYDQELSCPGFESSRYQYALWPSNNPSYEPNFEIQAPPSRTLGTVATYRCTGGLFYREGTDVETEGARECIKDKDSAGKYVWNATMSLPCVFTCPIGFQASTDNTSCYHFSQIPASGIIEAARECQKKGSTLAVINGSDTVPWDEAVVPSEYYFIGHMLKNGEVDRILPSNYICDPCPSEGMHCVAGMQNSSKSQDCVSPGHYLCELPGACPPNYEERHGMCYRYGTSSTFLKAQYACTQDGATLAFPETVADLDSLEDFCRNKSQGATAASFLVGLNIVLGNWTAGNLYSPDNDLVSLLNDSPTTDNKAWSILNFLSEGNGTFTHVDIEANPTPVHDYICQFPAPTECITEAPTPTANMTNCSTDSGIGFNASRCYECLPGYFLNGNTSETSRQQWSYCYGLLGEWYPGLTDCIAAEVCLEEIPVPSSPGVNRVTNSSEAANIRYLNSTMNFTCPEKLETSSGLRVQTITCEENSTHDGYGFTPEPENCNVCVGQPAVGNDTLPDAVSDKTYEVDQTTTITCNQNYTFSVGVNTKAIGCTSEGWEDVPVCYEACTSEPLTAGTNSERDNVTTNHIGTEVHYNCHEGFHYPPDPPGGSWLTSRVVKCNSDHEWDKPKLDCVKACFDDPPSPPPNGNQTWDNSRIVDSEVTLTCPANHTYTDLNTTLTLRCEETGKWTQVNETLFVCRIPCPNASLPTTPPNASFEGTSAPYWVGDKVNFTCGPGQESLKQETNVSLECEDGTGWSTLDSTFACFNACQKDPYLVGPPANSTWNVSRIVGEKVTYDCPSGLVFENLEPSVSVQCEDNQTWTLINPEILICRRECTAELPISPPNTSLSSVSPYWIETQLTYSCPLGFASPTGGTSVTITCLSNNTWTGIHPDFKCIEGCPKAAPVPPGDATSDDRLVHTEGTVVTYTCAFGFADGPKKHTSTCMADGKWHPGVFHRCTGEFGLLL